MAQGRQQVHPWLSRLCRYPGCSRHCFACAFLYAELVLDSQAEGSLVEEELLGGLGWDITGSKNCIFRALHCLGPMGAGLLK